ncbi:MAG TPA: FAD-dependent thymidylate synthase [Mesotoga sp.]|nr:FAD-dependent thymidylate synthase [Mesotoga sp.]
MPDIKVRVVNPKVWMLTPVEVGKIQLATCAYFAGLSHGKTTAGFDGGNFYVGCPDDLAKNFDKEEVGTYGHAEALVGKLLSMKPYPHDSIAEHSALSFLIRCSRIGSHEIVRHRHTDQDQFDVVDSDLENVAYTQQSTRYVEECKFKGESIVEIVAPPDMRDDIGEYQFSIDENYEVSWDDEVPNWLIDVVENLARYKKYQADGIKRESRRYFLQHLTVVYLGFTASFREVRQMIKLRAYPPAAPEMQELFINVRRMMEQISPVLVEGI